MTYICISGKNLNPKIELWLLKPESKNRIMAFVKKGLTQLQNIKT
jgi:hypothetical protein